MKIKFLPQNLNVEVEQGKSVMEAARENNLPVSSSCNGMCVCAECRIYIVDGEENVLPPSTKEVELIGGGHFVDRRRLSCQLFCFGDLTVDLSEQLEREQNEGGIKKQFLKKINKSSVEDSSSLGGVLLEQDKDLQKMSSADIKEDDLFSELEKEDDFYKVKGSHKPLEGRKQFEERSLKYKNRNSRNRNRSRSGSKNRYRNKSAKSR